MKSALVIAKQGSFRDQLRMVLNRIGYNPQFDSSPSRANYLLMESKPQMFVYEWEIADPSQGSQLFQKLATQPEFAGMVKIIIAPKVTTQLSALSLECGVHRILSPTMSQLNMEPEMQMISNAQEAKSDIQKELTAIKRGEKDYSQDRIDEVIEEAYSRHKADPDVAVEFGHLCMRREKQQEAKSIATGLIKKRPHDIRAMNLLARACLKLGEAEDAIKVLNYANTLNPESAARLVLMGEAHVVNEDLDAARQCFSKAMQLDPELREAREGAAMVDIAHGDLEQAVGLLSNSFSEEESVAFFNNSGVKAAWDQDPAQAVMLYEAALKVVKTDAYKDRIWFNIALGYYRLENYDQAHYALKRCLNYNENFQKAIRLETVVKKLRKSKPTPKAS